MENLREAALQMHRENKGKIAVSGKVSVRNGEDLSLAYSPGVAEPCKEIAQDKTKVYEYTNRGNTVAVVSDGTAVLGLGDIGPEAAMPVMEGKSILFKDFAGVDAFPICLGTKQPQEIISIVKALEPTFGGVNLEDISAPNCFIIEETLKELMNIPVFHDDQHGTAIVVCAGLLNALKLTDKKMGEIKVVINGAGAAGIAIMKLLRAFGVQHIVMCDTKGALYQGRPNNMNSMKERIARICNPEKESGTLKEVIKGKDVFVGVSIAGCVTEEMVQSMAKDPIIFALANPVPEIMPDLALKAGASVVATGRSDFANQVNNVLAFPGIFRGALDVQAKCVNNEMKAAAVQAIASLVTEEELKQGIIIPSAFNPNVAPSVAVHVAKAAMDSGVARVQVDLKELEEKTRELSQLK